MNKKEVFFVSFYSSEQNDRVSASSAVSKINYICQTLVDMNYRVNIISFSWLNISEKSFYFSSSFTEEIDRNIKVIYCPSISSRTSILRRFGFILSLLWSTLYLIFNIKFNSKVIVYHSPILAIPIFIIKLIKKTTIILEVEEIYYRVWNLGWMIKNLENLSFFAANKYILVSKNLKSAFPNKESLILYGAYRVDEILSEYTTMEYQDNDTIDIIYAGRIDVLGKAAYNAVSVFRYLPNYYRLNLCGTGERIAIDELLEYINKTNTSLGREACVYHGNLQHKEMDILLKKCKIGLNIQNDDGYMDTAFPSKILLYMSYNLHIYTTPIKSIVDSPFKNRVFFSRDLNPWDFTILSKDIVEISRKKSINNQDFLKDLHNIFSKDLKNLIEGDL